MRADCTRLFISSQAFSLLNPQVSALSSRLTSPRRGCPFQDLRASPNPQQNPPDTHSCVRAHNTPPVGNPEGPPAPRKNLVWIKSQKRFLALDEFNSRLISPLPTWVRFPTRPPPLSPAVLGCAARSNKYTRTPRVSRTPLPSFSPLLRGPHPISKQTLFPESKEPSGLRLLIFLGLPPSSPTTKHTLSRTVAQGSCTWSSRRRGRNTARVFNGQFWLPLAPCSSPRLNFRV